MSWYRGRKKEKLGVRDKGVRSREYGLIVKKTWRERKQTGLDAEEKRQAETG